MTKSNVLCIFICCLLVQCQAGDTLFSVFLICCYYFLLFNNYFVLKPIPAPDAIDTEIMALTERIFDASSPNLFSQINVNLQRRTYSSSLVDDAPAPYDLFFIHFVLIDILFTG